MKKLKLKLEDFESEQEKVLAPAFLSKILGGDGGSSIISIPNQSTVPDYTISALTSMEAETKDEVE